MVGSLEALGIGDDRCYLLGQLLGEGHVLATEAAAGRHERDASDHVLVGGQGHGQVRTELQGLGEQEVILVVRGLPQEVVAHVA